MPNTREKLIELIETTVPREKVAAYGEVPITVGQIADHLIANGVTFSAENSVAYNLSPTEKWIPLTERLPELETYTYSVDVLFRDYKEDIHVGYVCLETGTWREKYSRDRYAAHKVTHWMPLPEPPMDLPKITDQTMDAIKKIGEQAHGGE